MEEFEKSPTIFATLTPANRPAIDAFSQVAQKMLGDKTWNPVARHNIEANNEPVQVSTCSSAYESDGGTGPSKTKRPVLKGYYALDLAKPPTQPTQGWLIGGGRFTGDNLSPDILLTERKSYDRVSSRHARLAHNFASGALVISALNNSVVWINGHQVVNDQRAIHGRTTSLEFGDLKYMLEVRKYDEDDDFRDHLTGYKQTHGIKESDYPLYLLATPSDSDLVTKNYVLKNIVGRGSTCTVYAAYDRRDGSAVAIKKVQRSPKNAEAIKRDVEISSFLGDHVGSTMTMRQPLADIH